MPANGKYAADTKVPPERSRAQIEHELERYGAEGFGYLKQDRDVVIAFQAHGRYIRFHLTLPIPEEFERNRSGARLNSSQAKAAHEKAVRQKWRALLFVIKAKLEAVESGISTFEEEFLPYTVLPSGETVNQWLGPQLDEAYRSGEMPGLMPGASLALPG